MPFRYRLPSVKALRLSMDLFTHFDTIGLASVFPALQVLDFIVGFGFYNCVSCGLSGGQGQARNRECIRALLKPFAVACPALRKIHFDNRWFPLWIPSDFR